VPTRDHYPHGASLRTGITGGSMTPPAGRSAIGQGLPAC
jgi:hypothetical protein